MVTKGLLGAEPVAFGVSDAMGRDVWRAVWIWGIGAAVVDEAKSWMSSQGTWWEAEGLRSGISACSDVDERPSGAQAPAHSSPEAEAASACLWEWAAVGSRLALAWIRYCKTMGYLLGQISRRVASSPRTRTIEGRQYYLVVYKALDFEDPFRWARSHWCSCRCCLMLIRISIGGLLLV